MAACPYGVRFINPIMNFCQKCDWCVHRVEAGIPPACVDACPAGARIFGDLNDKESEISQFLATNNVSVLKPIMGTDPHTFYIDIDLQTVEIKDKKED